MSVTLTPEVLRKHAREVFFETGTYDGGGVEVALQCGIHKVYTCDRDAGLVARARQRFPADRVEVLHGDSRQVLARVLPTIYAPITFWLDAHDDSPAHEPTPLLDELSAIFKVLGCIGQNVILIDDLRCLGASNTWGAELSGDQLLQLIHSLDASALLAYEDNLLARQDILVIHGAKQM